MVPSRSRPAAARETVKAIRDTAALAATEVVVAIDEDDPSAEEYMATIRGAALVVLAREETGSLVKATNTVSMRIARDEPDSIIGNLGDDHRPRTRGWDKAVTEALKQPGIAYGDDLIHGAGLPSAPFISAQIPLALGWYALPTCEHLYIDDAWRELGKALDVLHFLPEVTIEHMHPDVGKGDWDEQYRRVNSRAASDRDQAAFFAWRYGDQFTRDVIAAQQALEVMA